MTSCPVLPLVEVAAGIIWRDGSILVAQRPKGKPLAGFWEFPGGKLKANESPEVALVRELAEELGICVHEAALWRIEEHDSLSSQSRIRLYFFQVSAFSGEPVPKEDQLLAWIRPEDASKLDFLPADAKILKELSALAQGLKPACQN